MGKSRPINRQSGRALFLATNRGYGCLISGAISIPIPGRVKSPKNEAFLSEIRVRKSDTAHSRRLARDFRGILGKSRPTRRQSGRPSPGSNRCYGRLISGVISAPILDRLKSPKNEAFLAAIRVRKSDTVNFQRLVHDSREILGKSRPPRRQSARPSF